MFDTTTSAERLLSGPKGRRVQSLLRRHKLKLTALMGEVHAAVEFVLGGMEPDVRYTARDLVGEEIWSGYTDGVRRAMGICLIQLVQHGELPLMFANGDRVYPRRYRIDVHAASVTR